TQLKNPHRLLSVAYKNARGIVSTYKQVWKGLVRDLSRVVKRHGEQVINLAPSESRAPANQISDLSEDDHGCGGGGDGGGGSGGVKYGFTAGKRGEHFIERETVNLAAGRGCVRTTETYEPKARGRAHLEIRLAEYARARLFVRSRFTEDALLKEKNEKEKLGRYQREERTAMTGGRARKGRRDKKRSGRQIGSRCMREGSEKGRVRKRRWNTEGRGRKDAEGEGRKRRGFDEVQEQEDEGKKVGKKGLSELSLCAKQLPGLPGASARRRKRLCYSFSLSLSFPVSVLLRVADTYRRYRALGNRRSA
ncbi:hypothetical protein X777_04508, partial [Ooceraea biroi]